MGTERMRPIDIAHPRSLSGVSALIRHCAIHVLSDLDARKQLWPLRDHWADNSRGRSAPTPSLVCHFVRDAPLSMTAVSLFHSRLVHGYFDTAVRVSTVCTGGGSAVTRACPIGVPRQRL